MKAFAVYAYRQPDTIHLIPALSICFEQLPTFPFLGSYERNFSVTLQWFQFLICFEIHIERVVIILLKCLVAMVLTWVIVIVAVLFLPVIFIGFAISEYNKWLDGEVAKIGGVSW